MKDEKVILDACCGGRTFWFDKHHPNAVYVDKRDMEKRTIWTSKDGKKTREFEVHPDVVADFTNLPFADETFWHVVFDPPHLERVGETSWLAAKYYKFGRGHFWLGFGKMDHCVVAWAERMPLPEEI